MSSRQKVFWITTLITAVLGIVCGLIVTSQNLIPLGTSGIFLIFMALAMYSHIGLEKIFRVDMPLGMSGTLYLLGVMVVSMAVVIVNFPLSLFGLALLIFAWLIESSTKR